MVQINNGSGPGVYYDQTVWLLATNATVTVDTTATAWSMAFSGNYVAKTSTYNYPYLHSALFFGDQRSR